MMTDANVEAVRAKLLERSMVGIAEYGTTTERTDYTELDWIKELQTEMLDAAVYCEALIRRLEGK